MRSIRWRRCSWVAIMASSSYVGLLRCSGKGGLDAIKMQDSHYL